MASEGMRVEGTDRQKLIRILVRTRCGYCKNIYFWKFSLGSGEAKGRYGIQYRIPSACCLERCKSVR